MSTKTNSRKILLPLATLLVAAAVAVGSGATFTSTTDSAISATAGTLDHGNSQDTLTLTVENLKPGATENGTATITNVGSLDSDLTLVPTLPITDGFEDDAVVLTIQSYDDAGVLVPGSTWTGDFDELTATPLALGSLTAGQTVEDFINVKVTVHMDVDADNDNQGKSASVDFEFVTTQTDETNNESVVSGWLPFV